MRSAHFNRSLIVAAGLGALAGACKGDSGDGLIDRGSCDVLIECAASIAPETRDEYEQTYGPGGTCWTGGPDNWAACRNNCVMSLDAINQIGELTGETCGTCSSDADCDDFGAGSYCAEGVCATVPDAGDDDAADEAGETAGTDTGPDDPFADLEAVSILMVLDDSGSMGPYQELIALSASQLVAPLDDASIPWRLGLTSTDNGNPTCSSGTIGGGQLVLSSCLSRPQDFIVDGQDATWVCDDTCQEATLTTVPSATKTDPDPKSRPWIDSVDGLRNVADELGNGVKLSEAMACLLPLGVRGCDFGSPLETASRALTRAQSSDEDEFGFVEDGRLLVLLFVTDAADCSSNEDWPGIFEADGGKTFWSDPNDAAPTNAVCWNAGVECSGPVDDYDDCVPADKAADGSPAANADAAVLTPVETFVERYREIAPTVAFAIVGVNKDGTSSYSDATYTDPAFQHEFGIGPGCEAPNPFYVPGVPGDELLQAVPPVRLRAVLEALGPKQGQAAYSICDIGWGTEFFNIGEQIASYF